MSDYVNTEPPQQERNIAQSEPLFKKWHKMGFVSVEYWARADRFTIEVGSTDENGGFKSATKCFLEAPRLLSYLHSEINGQLLNIFPKFEQDGFIAFGGGVKDNKVISRVFKSTYWNGKNGLDKTGRAFKCGHFEGTLGPQNSVIPNYNKSISANSMRIPMDMLAEMYEKISFHRMMESHTINHPKDAGR